LGIPQLIFFLQLLYIYFSVKEKCLQPKNPLYEDKGDGWGALRIRCLELSIKVIFFCASLPQRIKTRFFFRELNSSIILFVKISHPLFLWLPGKDFSTVKIVLSSRMPCSDHDVRQPWLGSDTFVSSTSSLNIFRNVAGIAILVLQKNLTHGPVLHHGMGLVPE